MSQKKEGGSFFDSNTLIAIALVGVAWFGWNSYMQKKYPDAYNAQKPARTETDKGRSSTVSNGKKSANLERDKTVKIQEPGDENISPSASIESKEISVPETLEQYNAKNWSFAISSKGMGLKNIVLNAYTDRKGRPKTIGLNKGFLPFETNVIGRTEPLDFEIQRVEENLFVGQAQVGAVQIVKKMNVNPDNYSVDTKVTITGDLRGFVGIKTYLSEELKDQQEASFFMPYLGGQELYVNHGGEEDRLLVDNVVEEGGNFSNVKLASLGTHYFAMGLLDKSTVRPQVNSLVDKEESTFFGILKHEIIDRAKSFQVEYVGFAGPKSMEVLQSIDETVVGIIDFGWFNSIATYILKLMKVFYGIVGNWGVAIILLTLVVRIILLPLNIISFRSMKAMQVIQPEIKALREKYKDDSARLNQEMMALWKAHKVNPMAGCLPMVIQFPVFIALYRVLGQSIELYQTPFAFWITDLSEKDPYYILPILMGLAMAVQMKVQPNTMEPAQRKIMMFMPILFTFFMLSLPSGLTLYILVSTLFGLAQHFYFFREKKTLQPA